MIVLDFETNSGNVHDVIEAAAFRVEEENNVYVIKETFHRYYVSAYPLNPYALAIHKLTPERLERLREGKNYPTHFVDDTDFVKFCETPTTLVAHNIAFELRHIGSLAHFTNHICTMKENKQIVQATNVQGRLKNPKLIETCVHYGIAFDDEQYHSALYDVTKTLEILNKMKKEIA